ncbi:DUF2087 domain-containing protein [Metasolibacillus meyeri]|uniref:DUF2087 domain-containing protein n=1 Tax=Metasolibacillus meyeri TaxID=1071052 RepID=A0AAW9NSH3_9BACL|nr:DUF2087 domain-containing protein [Metasolibacillus meyeri]MEC1177781.1 DUF2087 domain-containing protein [Metasolibacillus meyeri]
MDFQSISIEELMNGYQLDDSHYRCIHCEKTFFVHEVYPFDNQFLTAEGMVQVHLQQEHGSAFHALLQMDKKTSGLSEVQQEMLKLFYEGLSDKEIAVDSSVNNISTVRQHRFKLREKERQAKVFLALMQLLSEPNHYKIHRGATQVDERYSIEEKEREKVLQTYFKQGLDGGIETIPSKEKRKLIILQHILQRFTAGKAYTEKEVNTILKTVHADFVTLRRYLIEYGFMSRSADGSSYWIKE